VRSGRVRIVALVAPLCALALLGTLQTAAEACEVYTTYTPVTQRIEIRLVQSPTTRKLGPLTIIPRDGSDSLEPRIKFQTAPTKKMRIKVGQDSLIHVRLNPGYYELSIEQEAEIFVIQRLLVEPGERISRLEVTIPTPQMGEEIVTGSLRVQIMDETGAVISGAPFNLLRGQDSIVSGHTDLHGLIAMPLDKGKYILVVHQLGFRTARIPVSIAETRSGDVRIKLKASSCGMPDTPTYILEH
jgi:hypothetical protein